MDYSTEAPTTNRISFIGVRLLKLKPHIFLFRVGVRSDCPINGRTLGGIELDRPGKTYALLVRIRGGQIERISQGISISSKFGRSTFPDARG